MPRPRPNTAKSDPGTDWTAEPVPLSPLNISGVVVTKMDLVEALRIYVPLINGIEPLDDGNHFVLTLDPSRVSATDGGGNCET